MLQEFLALCHGLPDTDCAALLCEVRGVSSRKQLSHADLTLEEVVIALSLVSHRMHPGTGGFDAPRLAATPPPSDFPFSCMGGPWYTADMLAGDSLCNVHANPCINTPGNSVLAVRRCGGRLQLGDRRQCRATVRGHAQSAREETRMGGTES